MKQIGTAVVFPVVLLVCSLAANGAEITLRILAFDRPQTRAEQRLADTLFTSKTGIKVILETNTTADLLQKVNRVAASKDPHYDLLQYDNEWLGALVSARALERLDTSAYLGTNTGPVPASSDLSPSEIVAAATNTVLQFSDFRPEIAYRVTKYPTSERDLRERKFGEYAETPVYGLPWNVGAEILVSRVDIVEDAFTRVPPAASEFYNSQVQPNWKDQWQFFVSAAGLVQIINPMVHGVAARAGPVQGGILEDFLPILWSFGGELWDEKQWRVDGVLNSATNLKALQHYCDWNQKSKIVPPESATWAEANAVDAIATGKAAMGALWPYDSPQLEDPNRSRAAARLEYSPLPGLIAVVVQPKPSTDGDASGNRAIDAFQAQTTVRRATLSGCEGVGIWAFSTQKQAAWQYLQWLASRETQLKLIYEPSSMFASARIDLAGESASASPCHKAVMQEFDIGMVRSRWNIPEATSIDLILARECNLAFRGIKTPKDALDTASKEIQAILDKSPNKPK